MKTPEKLGRAGRSTVVLKTPERSEKPSGILETPERSAQASIFAGEVIDRVLSKFKNIRAFDSIDQVDLWHTLEKSILPLQDSFIDSSTKELLIEETAASLINAGVFDLKNNELSVAIGICSEGDQRINSVIAKIATTATPGYNDYSNSLSISLAGGALMKGAEAWPAVKYLLSNWVPLIPTAQKYGLISDFMIKNEYAITTSLYAIGASVLTYTANANPYYAIISTLVYATKPYIYQLENELLTFIYKQDDTSSWLKLGLYIATEISTSVIVSLPMAASFAITLDVLKFAAIEGAFLGPIKYIEHSSVQEGNIIGTGAAFISASMLAALSINDVIRLPSIGDKIILTASSIASTALVHRLSKLGGDWAGEYIFEFFGVKEHVEPSMIEIPLLDFNL